MNEYNYRTFLISLIILIVYEIIIILILGFFTILSTNGNEKSNEGKFYYIYN